MRPPTRSTGLNEPGLSSVRDALRLVLAGHEPYPAAVIDRWWEMLDSDSGAGMLSDGCAAWLLEPPVNVPRLRLPGRAGAADRQPRRVAGSPAHQLRHRARALGDERLNDLRRELSESPGGQDHDGRAAPLAGGVVLPLRHRRGDQELSFFSNTASVSTATDMTVEELAIEAFYPADTATAAALRAHAVG